MYLHFAQHLFAFALHASAWGGGGGVGVVQLPRRMRSDAEDPSDDERGRTPTRAEAWRKQPSESPVFLPSERQLCPALNLKVRKL